MNKGTTSRKSHHPLTKRSDGSRFSISTARQQNTTGSAKLAQKRIVQVNSYPRLTCVKQQRQAQTPGSVDQNTSGQVFGGLSEFQFPQQRWLTSQWFVSRKKPLKLGLMWCELCNFPQQKSIHKAHEAFCHCHEWHQFLAWKKTREFFRSCDVFIH